MKAIVVGSNGYLGSHLVSHLRARDIEVLAHDLQPSPDQPGASYQRLDVTDRDQVADLDVDADLLFLLAGRTGTTKSFEQFEQYIDTNEKGLLQVAEHLKRNGSTTRILFPSTRLVYRGVKGRPLREDADTEVRTVYAQTKLACENYLAMYGTCFGLHYTVFRICVPYGNQFPGRVSNGTAGFLQRQAENGGPVTVYGDGSQRRSLVHIDDLCALMLQGGLHPDGNRRVLNIGGPEALSIREMAACLANRHQVDLREIPWNELDEAIESGDTILDSSAIEALTGYVYRHRFQDWVESG